MRTSELIEMLDRLPTSQSEPFVVLVVRVAIFGRLLTSVSASAAMVIIAVTH